MGAATLQSRTDPQVRKPGWSALNPGVPILFILVLVGVGISADLIAPYAASEGDLGKALLPPVLVEGGNSQHLLGTDLYGRDYLSRIIFGSRVSLSVAALSIAVAAAVGSLLGLMAGYARGWVDALVMRLVDIGLSIPMMLIAIVAAAIFGPSFLNVVLILGLLLWPRFARQIRAETLVVMQQDYVALARVGGCSATRILMQHVVPNVVPTLLVLSTLNVGYVIVVEASLSFLGVGIPEPTPSWGQMVANGTSFISSAWWLSLLPGLAIMFTVLSLNFFGDWLRDRVDPRLRQV